MALGRVAVVKDMLGVSFTTTTYDSAIENQLIASSGQFEAEIGYDMDGLVSCTEVFSPEGGATTIYLTNLPLVSVTAISISGTAQTLTDFYCNTDRGFVYLSTGFTGGKFNTKITYKHGIDTTSFALVTLGNTSFMKGYRDIEDVVCEDAAIRLLERMPSQSGTDVLGQGRLGIVRIGRDNRDTAQYDEYIDGFTRRWTVTVNRYKHWGLVCG